MHGTEVQRLLSRVYRTLFTPTLAILTVDPQTPFTIVRREALGAEEIHWRDFLDHLTAALELPIRIGRW